MSEELGEMSPGEIRGIADSMRKSATNVYSLLENLLEWSMMQRGLTSINPMPVRLTQAIKKNMELFSDSAQKKEIGIIFDIRQNLMVNADVHMFETVVRNLVSNAVKFTPKGGKINISAREAENGFVEISIRDTGIGMDQELIGRLFRLNEQANRKGTEGEPSVGLGLLICKDFIGMHGGKLWVESREGEGSTFHFTLPEIT
jgi:signal transduction histidine kinase